MAGQVVWRAAFLWLAGEQGLQDAHPRAALALPQLHRMPALPRLAPQARGGAVAARRRGDPRTARLAGQARARFHRRLPFAGTGRGRRPASATRNPRATRLPGRGRSALSDPRPRLAHTVGWRIAAHPPHHRARYRAGEYAVRARRAVHRPASARCRTHRRCHGTSARCRQYAGGGRARSADHAGC